MAPSKHPPSPAFLETVGEITRIYRSLPPRPSMEEVEAAASTVETVNNEENMKLEEISMQQIPLGVPEELFSVLQDLKKTVVLFRSHEQRREALHLLQLDKMFQTFGDLILRASELVSGESSGQKHSDLSEPVGKIATDVVIGDESLIKRRDDEGESEEFNLNAEAESSGKASFSAGLFLFRDIFSEINLKSFKIEKLFSLLMIYRQVY